jgi:hypothetical protein
MNADILRRIQNADLVWAEVSGRKLDGNFIPLWISKTVAAKLAHSGEACVEANAYMLPLSDAAAAEIVRGAILKVKGPSAKWPKRLEMLRGPDGTYIAKRRV